MDVTLGLDWEVMGVSLGFHWECIGNALGMHGPKGESGVIANRVGLVQRSGVSGVLPQTRISDSDNRRKPYPKTLTK
jgi:hypothetical protein